MILNVIALVLCFAALGSNIYCAISRIKDVNRRKR